MLFFSPPAARNLFEKRFLDFQKLSVKALHALSVLIIGIAFIKIVFHLNFWILPVIFFIVGLGVGLFERKVSLYLFVFLFPFINSTPAFFDNGYPYNYMAPALFLLSGIVIANLIKNAPLAAGGNNFYLYYLFLSVLFVSAVFVFLRWSNITIDSTAAVGADTPVSPPIPRLTPEETIRWYEQRVSFATIFPVVSLFIYFISPYIFFYIKKIKPKEFAIFKWLSYGFFVSVSLAVLQKISGRSIISDRLGKELKQFYGGFSDFNAFGFFSGVMFLWSTYEIRNKHILGYVTFAVSLLGTILSGSRTAFFFILAGIGNLIFFALKNRKKQQKIAAGILVAGVILLVIFAGGTLKNRLTEGFDKNENLFDTINSITNGRLWMTLFSLETVKDNFITGVGTGNFTFYQAYKNYLPYKNRPEEYLYDLPLNHYLLVFTENGVLGFLFFTLFMIYLYRRSSKKLLIGTILFALLFNNFFWFPEAFLLFWILAALNDTGSKKVVKKEIPYKKIVIAVSVLIFLVFNVVGFNSLHPGRWAQENRLRYDYGFWDAEKDGAGNEFHWTKECAGIYLTLDKKGESARIKLFCGAPLAHLKGKKQEVEIYWQGKLYREIIFTENKEFYFAIKSEPLEAGFLEVRVKPVFNLKELGLGEEVRDLGVQFSSHLPSSLQAMPFSRQ